MKTLKQIIFLVSTIFALAVSFSPVTAIPQHDESFSDLDSVIRLLMRRYDLPAASVAVVRNDSIIHVAAFGYTDTVRHKVASTRDRYRIASLSKPVTMIGILTLAAQGKLSLDAKVFGSDGILGNKYGPVPPGSGKESITVRHLLEHTAGWENIPNDPMFSYPGASQRQIISWILAKRPLAAPPGTKYCYSNFGYLLLGRIIEQVSNQPYERFIRRHVLRPCGIRNMRIGANRPRLDEPIYYLLPDEINGSYHLDVQRMDAHGGWIASAEDLARFMIHINRNPTVADIIPSSLMSQFYLGYEHWVHTGSLPGTAAVMIHIDNQHSFVLLSNKRSFDEQFWNDMSQLPVSTILDHRIQ